MSRVKYERKRLGNMDVVLGGKFESAILRAVEAENSPGRLPTTHRYYLALQRWTDRLFFERAATFSALSTSVEILGADWSGGSLPQDIFRGDSIGLLPPDNETVDEHESQAVAASLIDAISGHLFNYMCEMNPADFPLNTRAEMIGDGKLAHEIAVAYLRRLIGQVQLAGRKRKLLVLHEQDLAIICEVSEALKARNDFRIDFPDLSTKAIDGVNFGGGLLSFNPVDLRGLSAARNDPEVKKYAQSVRNAMAEGHNVEELELNLLRGMRRALSQSEVLREIESVVETASIVAAPITYVPVIGNMVSAGTDVASVGGKLAGKAADKLEWFLLASRANEVAVKDFLKRKGNL